MADDDWSASSPDRGGGSRPSRRTGRSAGSDPGGSRWAIAPYSVAGQQDLPATAPSRTAEERPQPQRRRTSRSTDATTDGDAGGQAYDRTTARPRQPYDLRPATQLGTRANTVLAGFGGVVLIIVAAAIGASVDLVVSDEVGRWCGIALCLGSAVAALMTRKSDLLSVIVAPPIIYSLFAGLGLWLRTKTSISVTSLASIAVSGFAPMALATGLAALVAGVKLLTTRAHERP